MFNGLPTSPNDHATADLPLLFEHNGVAYHRLDLVIRRIDGRYSGIYALFRDWDQTTAGELAIREQIIALQRATITQQSVDLAEAQIAKEQAEKAEREARLLISPLRETIATIKDENERLRTLRDAPPQTLPSAQPEQSAQTSVGQFAHIRKLERAVQDYERLVASQSRDLDAARILAREAIAQRDALLARQPTALPGESTEQRMHRCSRCKQLKSRDEFYLRETPRGSFRLSRSECKSCTNHNPIARAAVAGELDCPECLALGLRPKKPLTTLVGLRRHRTTIHHVPIDVVLQEETREIAA